MKFVKSAAVVALAGVLTAVAGGVAAQAYLTITEVGFPGVEVTSWWGLLAPAATPRDIVTRLNSEIVKILALSDAHERIAAAGADILTSTPQQFADFIRTEHTKWGQLIKESGAKVE